jgi:hypothetical protein
MPSPESMGRFQRAVLWTTYTNEAGEPVVNLPPEEIKVRWPRTRRNIDSPQNNTNAVTADQVIVYQEIAVGSLMWLGALDDIPGTSYVPESDIMEVESYSVVPDLKGRRFRQEVSLKKFMNKLPTS